MAACVTAYARLFHAVVTVWIVLLFQADSAGPKAKSCILSGLFLPVTVVLTRQ